MGYNRYVLHPARGSARDLFAAGQPLGAGRAQVILAGNAAFLARENACRHLASHQGILGIWRAAKYPPAPPAFTSVPDPSNIEWDYRPNPIDDGYAAISLGTHYVHVFPGSSRYPRLRLRYRAWLDPLAVAGTTLGVCLVVCPGTGEPEIDTAWSEGAVHTTTTVPDDGNILIDLEEAYLRSTRTMPHSGLVDTVSEGGDLLRFTVYLGAYNSSDDKTTPGNIAGISLYLEPPP